MESTSVACVFVALDYSLRITQLLIATLSIDMVKS